ncbi:MAG TPA: hypothetical protein VGM11_14670 [Acidobacteriaceae bacterium]|jgi:hypothetical protein
MRRQGWWAAVALALLVALGAAPAKAQDTPDRDSARGQFAGMQRVGGIITAITGPQVTIKTVDGAVYQVVTTDNTRVMRGRGVPGKMADLKAGDGLMAMGNLDAPNKTLHAAMIISVDADQMKQIEEARKQQLANLGKTLIAGRVTAIDMDNATMTVERPDGVSQTIGFDEGTSFRRGRLVYRGGFEAGTSSAPTANQPAATPTGESITLADIKVGDRVAGPGEVKAGRFIAKDLTVMTPGAGRRASSDANATPGPAQPAAPAQPPK